MKGFILLTMGVMMISISERFGGIKVETWEFWAIMIGWVMVYWAGIFSRD